MRLLPGNLGLDDDSLVRENGRLARGDGDFEGSGRCFANSISVGLSLTETSRVNDETYRCLTRIVRLVQGGGKDLEGTGKVHEVELGMQGEEHINGLIGHCRRFVCHLNDLVVVVESEVRNGEWITMI